MTNKAMKFKTIKSQVNFLSHFIFNFLENEGDKIEAAYHRLGIIVMLTSADKELNPKVTEWKEGLNECVTTDIEEMRQHKQAYLDNLSDIKIPEVLTPEHYQYTFSIQHPVMWKLIEILKELDAEISEIENLWLAGMIPDDGRLTSINRATEIIRTNSNKIYKATSPGKGRNGRFNVGQFLGLLRGGLELYINDEDLEKLSKRKFTEVNAGTESNKNKNQNVDKKTTKSY